MALNPHGRGISNYGAIGDDTEVVFSDCKVAISNVTSNIETLNDYIRKLKSASQSIGTQRDNGGLRDNLQIWESSANEIIKETLRKCRDLDACGRRADKAQKIQIKKVTDYFKDTVDSFNLVQKDVAQKLRHNLQRSASIAPSENEATLLLEQEEEQLRIQKQEHDQLQFEQEMVLDRERRIIKIEENIVHVNQIMKELGALVHEQGTIVDTIEHNIESVHQHVEDGAQELVEASRQQAKARNRKLFILLILAIVLIALIVTIVVASK